MPRLIVVVLALLTAVVGSVQAFAATSTPDLKLVVPAKVQSGVSFAFEFRLPERAAAVDGRIFLDTSVAEVVGLAPVRGGTALAPVEIPGGVAFGAYGLSANKGRTAMRVVVAPHADAELKFRIVIDAVSDVNGTRVAVASVNKLGTLRIGRGMQRGLAPRDATRVTPPRAARTPILPVADGTNDAQDLDVVRAAWVMARANGDACNVTRYPGADVNRDGCVDIADLQAAARSITSVASTTFGATASVAGTTFPSAVAAAAPGLTFVVNSTGDGTDVNKGDGVCADSSGACTLRAAIIESNWRAGDNRIEFNLPGPAPARIQMTGTAMPLISDRTGGLVIDGYSQPGASVNTATFGSNAVPGIELRGTGDSPRNYGLFVTSAGNTIRGLQFDNQYRALFIDGVDAHDNRIVGNFFGYVPTGAADPYLNAYTGVAMNVGAHHNLIGTPDLADRNVIGRARKGVYLYGPGTNNNKIQNNLLCITPSGMSMASCYVGIDHDFGPKLNLTGGSGPGERNVIGPTFLNGVEISHGWDPNGVDTTEKWQNNQNEVIGNWVGFRGDGSYNASFRAGQNNPGTDDNGNAINVYDGSNQNLIEGNYIGAVWDGIQTMSSNSAGNIIRGNIVGESPLGQPAPFNRDGIVARLNTRSHVIEANIVKNAGRYGIGLTQKDVLWVRISRNIITDMSGTPIWLEPDAANPTSGANGLQAPPEISLATISQVSGTGLAGATVEVFKASRPAGQSGLPSAYLGSTLVAGDGTWSLDTTLTAGERVTALQIAPNNNTSQLSVNVAAVDGAPVDPPTADYTWAQQPGVMDVQFTDTSAGAPASWSWDFGDGGSSTEQSPLHQYTAAGDYLVTLTAANAGGSDPITKTVSVVPPPPVLFAADSFERNVVNGWGNADSGGSYIVDTSAANYQVANGVGTITIPSNGSSRSARLDDVSKRDVDIKFRVASDKVLSGANLIVYAVARRSGNNEYRPRIILNGDGTVSVNASVVINGAESPIGSPVTVTGLTQRAGSFIWLRTQVFGTAPTTIRIKAWANGQSEPAGWAFTTTNSQPAVQGAGSLALRAYLNSGGANAPVKLSFDDYAVSPATQPPPANLAADAFNRNSGPGWGFADIGGQYTHEVVPNNYNVANGVGTILLPSASSSRAARLDDVSQRDVDITFRVASDKVLAGASMYVYATARRLNNNEYRPRLIFNGNGTISVGGSVLVGGSESALGSAVVVPGLTQSANSFIRVRAQVVGAGPTTIRIRAWADGQPEPSGWQFSATNSQAVLQAAGSVALRCYLSSGGSNAPVTVSFDDYVVTVAQ